MQRDVDCLAENGRTLIENIKQQQLVVLSKIQKVTDKCWINELGNLTHRPCD